MGMAEELKVSMVSAASDTIWEKMGWGFISPTWRRESEKRRSAAEESGESLEERTVESLTA